MNDLLPAGIGQLAVTPVKDPRFGLHVAIFLADGKTIDDSQLRLVQCSGQERISESFDFELELHGNTDASQVPVSFDALLGRPITVVIDRPYEEPMAAAISQIAQANWRAVLSTQSAAEMARYASRFAVFNGIVTSFSLEQPGVYRAGMKAALWKLSLTNRYLMHTARSVRDAIAWLLGEHGIDCSVEGLAGSDNLASTRVQDWLQAGESDLDFLQRLMAKAHVFYYFEHYGARHRVVFANKPGYPRAYPNNRPLRYTYSDANALGQEQDDVLYEYSYRQTLSPSGVRTVFAQQNAASESEAQTTYRTLDASAPGADGPLPFHLHKVYQYGLEKSEVEHYTAQTARALRRTQIELAGSSSCPLLRSGYEFRISGDVRPELNGRSFVASSVKHEVNLDGVYRNQFEATDAACLLAPFSLQDTQQGALLARVVPAPGANGGTAPCGYKAYVPGNFEMAISDSIDRNASPSTWPGRGVYVEFAADLRSADARSRVVWVRVAAHMRSVPEIGAMVVVARANDESELPEVQSIIGNNGEYTITPTRWTYNTHVGSTSSTSYGDGQNIRYGKTSHFDLPKAMGIVDAKYKTGSFREVSFAQGASYGYSTSENAEKGLLSEGDSFGSTVDRRWAASNTAFSATGKTINETIVGKSDTSQQPSFKDSGEAAAAVSASKNTVYGNVYNSNTVNGNETTISHHTGTSDQTTAVDGASTSTATYGSTVKSTTTHKGDVEQTTSYKGTLTTHNTHDGRVSNTSIHHADASSATWVTGTLANKTVADLQTTSTAIGASNSNEAMGVQNHNSAIGTSNANSAVGVSIRNSAVGVSTDITGVIEQLSIAGHVRTDTIQTTIFPGLKIGVEPTQQIINTVNLDLKMLVGIQIVM